MTLKNRIIACVAGCASVPAPCILINHYTQSINPGVVFAGVVFCSLVSYAYGTWSMEEKILDDDGGTNE